MDRAAVIFNNRISPKVYAAACKSQAKHLKKYGDDRAVRYALRLMEPPVIHEKLGVEWLKLDPVATAAAASPAGNVLPDENGNLAGENACENAPAGINWEAIRRPVVVGNIRMGFGHYRIAMAMASAARALGCTPLWFDLCAFEGSTCAAIVNGQNKLYSLGSRLSQRIKLFNTLFWEPLNSEGFRQLSYNAADQKTAELFAPVYADLPKDVPFVGTHAWTAQGAAHAGLTHVVNAIPDNWPMALHYAEGSIHTVQTPFAFEGYRVLSGMAEDGGVVGENGAPLKSADLAPMPEGSLVEVGHYIDHELVVGIPDDCAARIARAGAEAPVRYLVCVGGAGAQQELIAGILAHLAPLAAAGKAVVLVNVGDHANVWEALKKRVPALADAVVHKDDYAQVEAVVRCAQADVLEGIHVFCQKDIFGAVYSTNELMRVCDVLVTKPSELAYYPVPKLMIRRVGGHEAYGAIRAHEVGDGTAEIAELADVCAWIDAVQADRAPLVAMNEAIIRNREAGLYDGAYKAVKLALGESLE